VRMISTLQKGSPETDCPFRAIRKGAGCMDMEMKNGRASAEGESLEILHKMMEKQEKGIRLNRIVAFAECFLLAIMLTVTLVLGPVILRTVRNVNDVLEQVDTLVDNVEGSLEEIKVLAQDADDLVVANEEAVNEAIGHFNEVDFESLNRSIERLSNVLKPMSEIVEFFDK